MAQYPPIIAASLLPAIYKIDGDGNSSISINIPFEYGRATQVGTITQIRWIIKSAVESVEILSGVITKRTGMSDALVNKQITLLLTKFDPNKMLLGNYYKIQIAFVTEGDNIPYYSTAGTFKLIDEPIITITEDGGSWIGTYSASYSSLESSYFVLRAADTETILESSEKIYHNLVNQGKEIYRFNTTLNFSNIYTVEWITVNDEGYESSISSEIVSGNTELLLPDINVFIKAENDLDNGTINLSLYIKDENGNIITPSADDPKDYGSFVISKSSSIDNFNSWREVYRFENLCSYYMTSNLNNPLVLIRDANTEFGVTYQYCIQQYNENNIYSLKKKSELVKAYFDHTFLTDENRQLCLRFNPKVSSMKTVVMESKQNTLGGAYPIIFRNGETNYKEFSISGLISYLQDPDGLFSFVTLGEEIAGSTDLTYENFAKEQEFKIKVLDWLNNGQPKLLKSPSEGTYVVQLMNVSLSPQDPLGRMIHNFSANATEVNQKVNGLVLLTLPERPVGFSTHTFSSADTLHFDDCIIKEILFYNFLGLKQTYSVIFHYVDSNETKTLEIGRAGYRYIPQKGERIQRISSKSGIIDGTRLDVCYESIGSRYSDNFDNYEGVVASEEIGEATGNNVTHIHSAYYKILQVSRIDGSDVDVNNNTLTYTDANKQVKTLYINSQLRLEDLNLIELKWGNNLSITYCRIAIDLVLGGPVNP